MKNKIFIWFAIMYSVLGAASISFFYLIGMEPMWLMGWLIVWCAFTGLSLGALDKLMLKEQSLIEK